MTKAPTPVHQQIKQGDIEAFEALFREYYKPLCHFANTILKDMMLAEEVVQEFFYRYWKNRETILISESLNAYMYQAVKNLALKQIERKKVRDRHAQSVFKEDIQLSAPASEKVETAEMHQLIDRTLKQMPERSREIFLLSRTEGMKYKDIANKLNISIKTVEANMGKALQLFRTSLSHYGELKI